MDRDSPATASRIEFQSQGPPPQASRLRFLILLTMIVPACSHDEGPELAPVTGKVTYQGKPITQGTISFQPVSPDGTPATGSIGTDGSYTLQTADAEGARLGDYRVVISARKEPETEPDTATPALKKKPVIESQLPLKYEDIDKAQLNKKVASGRNTIDFNLE